MTHYQLGLCRFDTKESAEIALHPLYSSRNAVHPRGPSPQAAQRRRAVQAGRIQAGPLRPPPGLPLGVSAEDLCLTAAGRYDDSPRSAAANTSPR
jgi:hypothetical protein